MTSQLQPWMRSTLLGEETCFIISTPTISIKDKASDRIKECIGLNLCKIRGPDKRRRLPTLQETMLQYMTQNDQRMKQMESQLTNIQSFLSQRQLDNLPSQPKPNPKKEDVNVVMTRSKRIQENFEEKEDFSQKLQMASLLRWTRHLGKLRFLLIEIQWQAKKG